MASPRVIIGMMMHETNTFSSVKTTLKDFYPLYGMELVHAFKGTRSGVGGFIDVLEKFNAEIIPSIGANATPSGPLRTEDNYDITKTVIESIKNSGRVDGVLLTLHGAMVVENIPEAEGILLPRSPRW